MPHTGFYVFRVIYEGYSFHFWEITQQVPVIFVLFIKTEHPGVLDTSWLAQFVVAQE